MLLHLTQLKCDICGATTNPVSGSGTRVRRLLYRAGWHYHHSPGWQRKYGGGAQDVCPRCYAAADHTPGRKRRASGLP